MHLLWRKLPAILILLWASVDLCVPQLCAAEKVLPPVTAQQTSISTCHDGGTPQSDNDDGDCFCCCSHVAPNAQFQIAALVVSASVDSGLVIPQTEDSSRVLSPPPRA